MITSFVTFTCELILLNRQRSEARFATGVDIEVLNPFSAKAGKISVLKDAGKRLQTVYFPIL